MTEEKEQEEETDKTGRTRSLVKIADIYIEDFGSAKEHIKTIENMILKNKHFSKYLDFVKLKKHTGTYAQ